MAEQNKSNQNSFYLKEIIAIKSSVQHDKRSREMVIRVFYGGSSSFQLISFNSALSKYIAQFSEIKAEYANTDDVKSKHWTPNDLFRWLEDADVHFIITHIHQGR